MKASNPGLARRTVRFALVSGLGVGVALAISTTSADVDLWGHVRFGLDILETLHLPSRDPYSFTSDRPWINHEWLAEVTFAAAWRLAGATGLIAVKLGAIAGALSMLFRTLQLRNVGGDMRLILVALSVAGILPRMIHVRPQLFSVLLFAALLWVFARVECGHRKSLALCPLILGLWVNFHGGWITGLGALALWTLGDVWARRHDEVRTLDSPLWTAVSAAATLISPYGVRLWLFLAETVRPGREGIGEWAPLWTEPTGLVVWLLFALMTVAALGSARTLPPARFLQPVFWGLASLLVVRLDAFFVLSVTAFLGPAIERFLGRGSTPRLPLPSTVRAGIVVGWVGVMMAIPSMRRTTSCIRMFGQWWPEPAAIEFIESNRLAGRMITFFNWGEYGIWHLAPSVKVSIDGRRETVYSDAVVAGHFHFYEGTKDGISYIESVQADYAWLPAAMPGASALRQNGWEAIFEGGQSVILAGRHVPRRGGSIVVPSSTPDQTTRCFPGP